MSAESRPPVAFDQSHAAEYDKRFAKLSAMRDALHLLTGAILADLPADARVLCVGAGTGAEVLYLAQKNPGWHFTAVDPSAPMLDVCRSRAEEAGIASRCAFHAGYIESLPATEPFDAATSILVSQFILRAEARTEFFRQIAIRLKPDGWLVSADLASDLTSPEYQSLLEVWMRLMRATDSPPEKIEALRTAYGRDVAVLPVEQIPTIIAAGGFESPVLFYQCGLIHGWYARHTGVTG